jgi:hypothetical protein
MPQRTVDSTHVRNVQISLLKMITCGLYYKHIMIVNDAFRVISV